MVHNVMWRYSKYIFYMKNTLELQLTQQIQNANRHFLNRQFSQALQQYHKCKLPFNTDGRNTPSISSQYLTLIYSLMAVCYSELAEIDEANHYFEQALTISPHHSATFLRRAHFYVKSGKLAEAIEDIHKVFLYEPENHEIDKLVKKILNKIQEIEDEKERSTLLEGIEELKPSQELPLSSNSELDFMSLKKIDKYVPKEPELLLVKKRSHQKKCSLMTNITFLEKLQPKSNENKNPNQRKSILKLSTVFNEINCLDSENKDVQSNFNVNSIKSIDGRLLSKETEEKVVSFSFKECEEVPTKQKKPRKSCLKSQVKFTSQIQNQNQIFSCCSFQNLKKIDKFISTQSVGEFQDKVDESQESNFTITLNHLEMMSIPRKGKRDSILKKNSMVIQRKSFYGEEHSQKKKSVCFN